MTQATLTGASPASGPHALLRTRLSVMMFLQYAIWGAWLPLMFPFLLGYRLMPLEEVGYIFAAAASGAIVGPFVSGQISDRSINTEVVLGVSHLIGAVLVYFLSEITGFWPLMIFAFCYSVVYSPTLSLTNSLSLAHLPDRDRDFGKVRVFGTVGWICAGIGIGQWLLFKHSPSELTGDALVKAQQAGMADAFKLSAVLGVVMGLFCLTLPKTPPAKNEKSNAAFKAIGEVRKQPLLTLFLIAVPISCVHQFYFVHTSGFLGHYQAGAKDTVDSINRVFGVGGGGLMTIGQMSEIIVLALIPLVAKALSRKSLLAIGLLAYAARMAIFAYVPGLVGNDSGALLPLLCVGVAMHGLCFGCFIFVAFLVIDENTTSDVRASAQSLFGLVVFGIGIIVGSIVATKVADVAKLTPAAAATLAPGSPTTFDYQILFSYPMWGALACFILLVLLYPSKARSAQA